MSKEIPPGAPAPARQFKQRVSGENRYPIFDLNASLILARAVKEKGGNACTPEQLGGYIGVKNTTGGSFVGRVASARAFELIRTVQGRYEITERAEAILYEVTPQSREQALRDAFLSIPLYRQIYERFKGQSLPQEFGLRNLLHTQFGVPVGDRVTVACRVMMDSAETAGFFRAHNGARTHLVDPIQGIPAYAAPAQGQPSQVKPGGGSGNGGGRTRHKVIEGALDLMPPEDAGWDENEMEEWFEFFKSAVRQAYRIRRATG